MARLRLTVVSMSEDMRPKVEAHRPLVVQRIKQIIEKLATPGRNGWPTPAAREDELNNYATQLETKAWENAPTRRDYHKQVKRTLSEVRALSELPLSTGAASVPATNSLLSEPLQPAGNPSNICSRAVVLLLLPRDLYSLSLCSKEWAELIAAMITSRVPEALRVRIEAPLMHEVHGGHEYPSPRFGWGGRQSDEEATVAHVLPLHTALRELFGVARALGLLVRPDQSVQRSDDYGVKLCSYSPASSRLASLPAPLLPIWAALVRGRAADKSTPCPDCAAATTTTQEQPRRKKMEHTVRFDAHSGFIKTRKRFACSNCPCYITVFRCSCGRHDSLWSDGCSIDMGGDLTYAKNEGESPGDDAPWCSSCFEFAPCGQCNTVEHASCMDLCSACGMTVCAINNAWGNDACIVVPDDTYADGNLLLPVVCVSCGETGDED